MEQPALGQKIAELRNSKRLTQKELAELCKVDIRTIQRIELGEVDPRTYTINLLSEVLGYDFKTVAQEETPGHKADLPVRALKFAFWSGLIYSVNAVAVVTELIEHQFNPLIKMFTFAVHSLSAMGFFYGFYLLGKHSKNQRLAISALLTIILLPLTNLLYLFDPATVGLVYVALCINCVFFGAGIFRQQSSFKKLHLIAGLTGIVQSLMFLSFNFQIQSTGLIISIGTDLLFTAILYCEYKKLKPSGLVRPQVALS